MSIPDIQSKGKSLLTVVIILLVGFVSYGFGRLSNIQAEKVPVMVTQPALVVQSASSSVTFDEFERTDNIPTAKVFVASKSGKAYYLPTCAAANRISEANKIWFGTRAEAERAGYAPAKNCPGL